MGYEWYALGVDYEMAGKDLSESVILSTKILNILGGSQQKVLHMSCFWMGMVKKYQNLKVMAYQ